MTVEIQQEHRLSTELVPVRIVDSDVHNVPRRGELAEFIPAPYRDRFAKRAQGAGDSIYYDAPDYLHAQAMRTDTFPEDGNFAGSDPALTFRQLIMDAGSDIASWGR